MAISKYALLTVLTLYISTGYSQHLEHIHNNLVEDYSLYDKAYRNSYFKSKDVGALEDWAVTQKYKVQLTEAKLLFDQAYNQNLLSVDGLKEYLELLLYQKEFLKYHQILENSEAYRLTEDDLQYFRELSAAWRMVLTQKSLRNKPWIFCQEFDSKGMYDWKNPNTEITWVIENQKTKKPALEHCFHQPGNYEIRIIRKNLLTGYFLPDSTFTFTIEEPMPVEFVDQPKQAFCGDWIEFKIADSMTSMCETVWTMGDGSIVIGNKIKHRYTVPGTYSITQYLTYSEHKIDHVESKTYQIYISREDLENKK